MSEVGSMTVGVDAVATKAKRVLSQLPKQVQGIRQKVVELGNMEIGQGSALALGITDLRRHFTEMVEDVQKVKEGAAEAGVSVTEFTKGLFSDADVERVGEFQEAVKAFKDTFSAGRKDLLIDIAPIAADMVKELARIMDALFEQAGKVQEAAGGFGARAGGFLSPGSEGVDFEQQRIARARAAAANRVLENNFVTGPSARALNYILNSKASDDFLPSDRADRQERLAEDRDRNELLRQIKENTASQGTTIEVEEANL